MSKRIDEETLDDFVYRVGIVYDGEEGSKHIAIHRTFEKAVAAAEAHAGEKLQVKEDAPGVEWTATELQAPSLGFPLRWYVIEAVKIED